ncbi:hypothetical protein SAPIO_CDS3368 [Scedosporium apiospermum]|uniref:ATPase inhibitor, mitochondrial n=1 Tax=Pseudallescheria apiosperma TaxID=563466 RepID=A0A084GAM3_PSEDA|nr:uncharacterized protein SAPIO_CDS3368 [Scedosporium apiospermum]KEZ44385.1 hypothetical protein SAPIO_CDS3368 [Scedosporium apiospermum]
MFRATIAKKPRIAFANRAAFSTTARAMTEGATGAPPKTGGPGDAFQRRERAQEDYAIRQREKEKLLELRKKLDEQQMHLKQLADHIDEITKDQGGEQN